MRTTEELERIAYVSCNTIHAELLANKLGWNTSHYGALLGGCLPDGSYCFVFNNAASKE